MPCIRHAKLRLDTPQRFTMQSRASPDECDVHALIEWIADATLEGHRKECFNLLVATPLLIVVDIDDLGMRKLPHTAAEDLLELVMRRSGAALGGSRTSRTFMNPRGRNLVRPRARRREAVLPTTSSCGDSSADTGSCSAARFAAPTFGLRTQRLARRSSGN